MRPRRSPRTRCWRADVANANVAIDECSVGCYDNDMSKLATPKRKPEKALPLPKPGPQGERRAGGASGDRGEIQRALSELQVAPESAAQILGVLSIVLDARASTAGSQRLRVGAAVRD